MVSLSLLLKPASYRCNLECSYCFYKRVAGVYEQQSTFMKYDVLDRLVETVMQSGARKVSFCWQGGEPTLMGIEFFRNAVALQKKYARVGQQIENLLQTNGVLLDDDWFRFLRDNRFLVGISLDGPADIHDAYRVDRKGDGTFHRVSDVIDGMRTYGVDFNILTLVHDKNVRQPDRLYDFIRRNNFNYLQFIPCFEVDEKSGETLLCSVDGRELGEFYCRLFDRWYEDGFPYVSIRFFEDILIYLVEGALVSCSWLEECRSYIVVEHNGDCYPCDFFVYPEWRLGNIMEDSLPSILNGEKREEFSTMKSRVPPACRDCRLFDFCHGDCTKFRFDGKGGYTDVSRYCEAWLMIFDHIDPLKDEIRDRAVRLRESILSGRFDLVGRNQPCPCGSGKKLKHCCGRGIPVL
ncbi:MAG TPA: anaerobic sulfatase maturase [Deltaproteobacteria bacterium]|nr:anaerobic sulfatase maturase [Deltaproteobacteria bacterium]